VSRPILRLISDLLSRLHSIVSKRSDTIIFFERITSEVGTVSAAERPERSTDTSAGNRTETTDTVGSGTESSHATHRAHAAQAHASHSAGRLHFIRIVTPVDLESCDSRIGGENVATQLVELRYDRRILSQFSVNKKIN
jgi:hypothetical protein